MRTPPREASHLTQAYMHDVIPVRSGTLRFEYLGSAPPREARRLTRAYTRTFGIKTSVIIHLLTVSSYIPCYCYGHCDTCSGGTASVGPRLS